MFFLYILTYLNFKTPARSVNRQIFSYNHQMSTIVGVFAHPDDEAMGPAGTIAKLAPDHDVHLICVTDGDHQDKGLKNIRDKELFKSAQILGVKKVIFLDFVDGSLSNSDYHQIAESLKKHLDVLKPETIITFHPNGVSGHIDHMVVTSVVNYLFPKLRYLKKVMYFAMRDIERRLIPSYFVHMPEGLAKEDAHEVVDTKSVWNLKKQAIQAHKSQSSDGNKILLRDSLLPKEEYFLVRSK